ncbi:MAG: TRAP transporter small permease [Lachnospiraceae bacterium]|nr:TRAP transporter small permease [Lachnospiraceae bacterium]
MEVLHRIRKGIDAVLSTACILLFALMVVVGTYQIVTRFVFNAPSTVSEELLTYSFAWMALLSAAYIFGKRDHMRMGFMADKLTGTKRKILEIAIEVLILVFAASVLIYGGFTIMNLTMTQKTASLGVMMGVIYTVVPLSGILIFVYGILNIIDLCVGDTPEHKSEEMQED